MAIDARPFDSLGSMHQYCCVRRGDTRAGPAAPGGGWTSDPQHPPAGGDNHLNALATEQADRALLPVERREASGLIAVDKER